MEDIDKEIKSVKDILRLGIEVFKYKKKDGTIREARGTLNEDIIAENDGTPSGNGASHNYSDDVIRYYDLDKNGWRSFLYENFIEFDLHKCIDENLNYNEKKNIHINIK